MRASPGRERQRWALPWHLSVWHVTCHELSRLSNSRHNPTRKHRKMAADPFTFLRGTFYRSLQIWPAICEPLLDAPRVLAVGDLHVENFGTWRDAEGRLIWGISDVDEACTLPYTQDLVRLATSAHLALKLGHLDLSFRQACQALLDGYQSSLVCGGRPIVLAERHRWLQQIAVAELKDPAKFWTEMDGSPQPPDRSRVETLSPRFRRV